jgi:protein-tyrosine phosphatase
VIDLHSHVLPGVDDGARTLEDSIELARALEAGGVELLAATPHVRADYPTTAETMERLVEETGAALREAGVGLELRPGGEIALDFLPRLDADELRRFGLGGNPGYLLVEFPYAGWPLGLESVVSSLQRDGITVVLGHPERNDGVQAAPDRLWAAVAAGALVQLTASSLAGSGGSAARRAAEALLDRDLAHLIAGDFHSATSNRAGMREAAETLGDEPLARWLTHDVPRAIVDDAPLPERPPRRPRRRRFHLR